MKMKWKEMCNYHVFKAVNLHLFHFQNKNTYIWGRKNPHIIIIKILMLQSKDAWWGQAETVRTSRHSSSSLQVLFICVLSVLFKPYILICHSPCIICQFPLQDTNVCLCTILFSACADWGNITLLEESKWHWSKMCFFLILCHFCNYLST